MLKQQNAMSIENWHLSYHWFAAAIFQPVMSALMSPPLL